MEKQDMAFEAAYGRLMERAATESRGERKRRLLEKHGHLEKLFLASVWWPVIGSLDYLHPEYEYRDLNGRVRFCDYSYMPSRAFQLAIEADGFGSHGRDMTRWQLDDERERQNHLLIDGWKLLRFTSDGIKEKSHRCQRTLLLAMAKWGQSLGRKEKLCVHERAIIQFNTTFEGEILKPSIVAEALQINSRTAIVHLKSLTEKGYFNAIISPTGRVMGYVTAVPDIRDLKR
ncbi:DNA-binding response regulator [Cohnella nanjingensis]|uniref:DNA-binding response regulator n=1 Tax=Cohnella nanjingensis TaxID=1387779 RepID=A0A7X0RMS4_9BACL|nr:DNA-binding response regulator [Cohnella nanjingensis]MBB6670153.1 DNA-binding response regulator [Cohnella nanjingensis]